MIKRISKKSISDFEEQVDLFRESKFRSVIDEFHRTMWLNKKIKIKHKTFDQVKQLLFKHLLKSFCFDENITKWEDLYNNYYFLETTTSGLYRIEKITNNLLCYMTTGPHSLLLVKLKIRRSFFNKKNTILWYSNGITSEEIFTYWNLNGTMNKFRAKKNFMEQSSIFKNNIKEILKEEK